MGAVARPRPPWRALVPPMPSAPPPRHLPRPLAAGRPPVVPLVYLDLASLRASVRASLAASSIRADEQRISARAAAS
jgi:hypothetical protein